MTQTANQKKTAPKAKKTAKRASRGGTETIEGLEVELEEMRAALFNEDQTVREGVKAEQLSAFFDLEHRVEHGIVDQFPDDAEIAQVPSTVILNVKGKQIERPYFGPRGK